MILYAEIHYGIFSRLKKKEPEIIADAPHRVEPGSPIPLLCLIKDADKYPVRLRRVKTHLLYEDGQLEEKEWRIGDKFISQRLWHRIFLVEPKGGFWGGVKLDVNLEVETEKGTLWVKNDNYRQTSHRPLEVYVARSPLPRFENWHFGDLHYHSSYTDDRVEFGAPLEVAAIMGKAIGLSFFCPTDHSYDLDEWEDLLSRAENSDFIIIPGEEVSCTNHQGRNVHLLVLNSREFIPGSGDAAEHWLRTRSEHQIPEVLEKMSKETLAFAAHPEITPPVLEYILIRRGKWYLRDYLHDGLTGLQILNGFKGEDFHRGLRRWVELLLKGRRLFIVAGNDAHGNFNRFRQIGLPFLTMREHRKQIFGRARTGVYVRGKPTREGIIKALKRGCSIITDGPIAVFTVKNEKGVEARIGEEIRGSKFSIKIKAKSSEEFGELGRLILWAGDLSLRREMRFKCMDKFKDPFLFEGEIQVQNPFFSYLRIDLRSKEGGRCLTNPIWINKEG